MKTIKNNIGQFEIKSKNILVGDPFSYFEDTANLHKINNPKNGIWNFEIVRVVVGSNLFCSEITGYSDLEINNFNWIKSDEEFGVETGVAGIFDENNYNFDPNLDYNDIIPIISCDFNIIDDIGEKYYQYSRNRLINGSPLSDNEFLKLKENKDKEIFEIKKNHVPSGIIKFGAICISGIGDGAYNYFYLLDSNKEVIAVTLKFI